MFSPIGIILTSTAVAIGLSTDTRCESTGNAQPRCGSTRSSSLVQKGHMLGRSTAFEAQEESEARFLLGPVVLRFLENVSSHPQHLSQVAYVSLDVTNAMSGQACPCTQHANYPCWLWGSCYSLSTQASCERYQGQFCGGSAAPACTCTWDPKYPCSLQGSCFTYSTQKACEDAGGDFCGETGPTPSPPAATPSPPSPTPSPPSPTSGAPSPTPPTPSGGLDTEMQAALDEHNRLRAMHHAPDLTWDNALASQAQSWADHCTFEHSTLGNGENLWAGFGSAFSGAAAVKKWYDELTDPGYDFSNPGFSSGTGHFTQVVWKSTTRLGCAMKVCRPLKPTGWNLANLFVCEYSPAGNFHGQFDNNVLPET